MTQQELEQRIREYVGQAFGPPEVGLDAVNEPMIRHWCETMGDANPIYVDPAAAKSSRHGGLVAPPTMMQA
ncbi:MAG: FAS1-like dehydratase domain-containing protein, partial [Myxococcota bacterium]